jgi:hypothetical protein
MGVAMREAMGVATVKFWPDLSSTTPIADSGHATEGAVRCWHTMVTDHSTSRPIRSITESPWYWVYVFCTAGLVALLLVGPRYSVRQTQIERSAQGRQRAIQNLAGEQPAPMPDEERTRISLRPLYFLLSVVLCIAWTNLIWRHRRMRAVQCGSVLPTPQG